MKIVLAAVNAKYIHSNLAVYSLKAYAKEYEEHIEIREYTINHYREDILAGLYGACPDVLAFSCYIWNMDLIRDLVTDVKQILPEVPVWLGGPEVSFDPVQELERMPEVAGIMVGEGEEIFQGLAGHYIEGNGKLEDLKGIVWRGEDRKIRVNPPGEPMDMNRLPFIYSDMSGFQNRIIYYEASRGCPFSCSYCLSSVDKRLRFRDLELVKKELLVFIEHEVPQVKFVDRTFNCRPEFAMAVWSFLAEHDRGKTNFHFEIAADILTDEELKLLGTLRPGLIQLEIGVQSTNPDTLREIRRSMDFKKVSDRVREIKRAGNIHQHLDLIAGLPFEGMESFIRSFNDVYELRPEQLQLGFLKVLKGSWMHEKALEYGLVYQKKPVYEVLCTRWLSYGEILRLKAVERVLETYYNSGQFSHALEELVKVFEHPFALYEGLALFYEEEGFDRVSQSRIQKYDILLAFAVKNDPEREELYRELLLLDLYLRENVKSRPKWAPSQEQWKQESREFYRQEEKRRCYLPDYEAYDARQLAKMTHLEFFRYPVNGAGGKRAGRTVLLFDYKHKNPLTNEALVLEIEDIGDNDYD
ncbi:B12-binding domain-containing radical SAM protein [Lachnospiraceae bacterium ASD3451]|uniref:B12-binding domain-containing radical SAM protein n=1 Tax=Diplocloster agilis TaxID=2850323 RepID=UPI001DA415DF|nr:B12-binding domain-containing radical SAM protein [Diplocloster agilis]MBU9746686.1 B12-binding domain-containing radical SAM protein [Diplocloster agilis]